MSGHRRFSREQDSQSEMGGNDGNLGQVGIRERRTCRRWVDNCRLSTDPFARWLYPETHQYLAVMGSLIEAFAGKAFPNGSAYCVDNYCGAALWLPPNVLPNEEALLLMLRSTIAQQRLENALMLFEKMGSGHPKEPH